MRILGICAGLLAALSLAACTTGDLPPTGAPLRVESEAAGATLALSTEDGRSVDVTILTPQDPVGVLLFSHGGGSSPEGMRPILDRLVAEGFVVLAPMHTDSRAMPADRRTDIFGAFPTRVADLKATAAFVAERYPDLPLGTFGYSYGSLIAIVGAGALMPAIDGQIEGLDAVVMFSSPGPIPVLTDPPGAFADVEEPTLLITGTADVVPQFVPDPKSHLVYFERLPAGDHTALVVKGATHGFVAGTEPGIEEVSPLVLAFLRSRMLGDPAATARFDAAQSSDRVDVRRR